MYRNISGKTNFAKMVVADASSTEIEKSSTSMSASVTFAIERVYTLNLDVFVELWSENTDTAGLGLVFICQ